MMLLARQCGWHLQRRLRWRLLLACSALRTWRALALSLASERQRLAMELHDWNRGDAAVLCVARQVRGDAALGRDLRARADSEVLRDARLPADHYVVPDLGAAGYARLRRDKAVLSDHDVVHDLH
jgi:hypothetical protein